MAYTHILVEANARPHIALIRLNRPKELNALNRKVMEELVDALASLQADGHTRCVVLAGDERAFAAGADIKEMAGNGAIDMVEIDQFAKWDAIKRCKLPLIAAVSGFALGGGCELSMICDMIVASTSAQFGQPEIKIGVMPGAGGTQRLTRAVGKARAMEMVLTGNFITAEEAHRAGLINKVVPVELYLEEALKLAEQVAAMSPLAIRLAKEAVLQAFEQPLESALHFERRNFYLLFASEDQKEGMQAFVDKRKPDWKGR
ncbi:MAG: enoyl-CoA hydratase-related protein [Bacteroidetes bacterium]|jgi:enoyl-CoA hydratase|nr:enoyl-CoA hydratase-related protein [Bacteroidota bacterium]